MDGHSESFRGARTTNQDLPRSRPGPDASPHEELLRRVQADDLDAFEEFFARFRTSVYRTAFGLTGDPNMAEEVLQDTFARAYERRASLRPDVSPLPWLSRVAINLCYTRLGRRRLRWEPIGDAVIRLVRDASSGPMEHAERMELRHIVRDGISGLPPRQQVVVSLYYLQGHSLEETAALLDLPLGTVKSRLHYALRALRDALQADERFRGAYAALADPDEAAPA